MFLLSLALHLHFTWTWGQTSSLLQRQRVQPDGGLVAGVKQHRTTAAGVVGAASQEQACQTG